MYGFIAFNVITSDATRKIVQPAQPLEVDVDGGAAQRNNAVLSKENI